MEYNFDLLGIRRLKSVSNCVNIGFLRPKTIQRKFNETSVYVTCVLCDFENVEIKSFRRLIWSSLFVVPACAMPLRWPCLLFYCHNQRPRFFAALRLHVRTIRSTLKLDWIQTSNLERWQLCWVFVSLCHLCCTDVEMNGDTFRLVCFKIYWTWETTENFVNIELLLWIIRKFPENKKQNSFVSSSRRFFCSFSSNKAFNLVFATFFWRQIEQLNGLIK